MNANFSLDHSYVEEKKEKVFLMYSFGQNINGSAVHVSEEIKQYILENHSNVIEEAFSSSIIEKLEKGEKDSLECTDMTLEVFGEELEVEINLSWEFGFGDLQSAKLVGKDGVQEYTFSLKHDVEAAISISCESDDEDSDDINFDGAKDFVENDIFNEIEAGETSGTMNFNFEGIDYSMDWEIN